MKWFRTVFNLLATWGENPPAFPWQKMAFAKSKFCNLISYLGLLTR